MSDLPDSELAFAGIVGQAELIRSGQLSARELTENTLRRIERLNPSLNAFTRILADEALKEATRRDQHQADGTALGPLHGVPIAIKDENDVAGTPTTYGGAAVTRIATADSEVVRRLRVAGAVVIGKTTMPEFGIWPFTETAAHGYTRNPWDTGFSTGGSSGGSAAAVASGMVAGAIGGDGGGSIRLPAAFCGLFGLKPQRGRVSTAPNRNLWRGLGTLGPLTRSVHDSALMYDAILGTTAVDDYRAEPLPLSFTDAVSSSFTDAVSSSFTDAVSSTTSPLRIAVSTRSPVRGISPAPEVVAGVHAVAEMLSALGHHVEEFDPEYPDATASFLPQVLGGVRDEALRVDRPDLLERRTRALSSIGRIASSGRVGKAAYRRGMRIAHTVNQVFDTFDVVLTPTTPALPRAIGQLEGAGLVSAARKSLPIAAYCSIWNVCGNPAAAVPAGFSESGLPLSVQLVSRPNGELTILALAQQLEERIGWPNFRPPHA
ncbi:amidase [Rhodococcus sp. IEGM 1379]|uniref:amidase n=1 Tax=Rhodococcus sp. IEGM 1379 TaxID=3047086 RepID=UPI0024B6870A|nr:amidase [Rhodococcus sp. IEGM 1379]MDI9917983.1 amidase [Rhodococcus sp. IEGM 1379]